MTLDIEDRKDILFLHKEYPITDFNWTLEFIFKQDSYTERDISVIKKGIDPILTTKDKDKLASLFNRNTYNSAISASDKTKRRSYIIMTQVSSIGQFVNSLVHEMMHLSRHIDECGNNEQLFTVLGVISGDIINKLYSL